MASPRRLLAATIILSITPATASAAPSWSASDAPGTTASQTSVAFDGAGNATAAWVQTDGSGSSVWTARRDAGASTFGAATRLTAAVSSDTAMADRPQLAVDTAGNAIVAWVGQRPTGALDVISVATRSGATGSWSAPQAASDTSLDSLDPTVGFSGTGKAVLAYDQSPSTGYAVVQVANVATATATVTPVQTISTANVSVTDPHLAFNASGAGELIWKESTYSYSPPYTGKSVLQGSYRAAGASTFPTGTLIYNSNPQPNAVADARVTLADNGTAAVAWTTTDTNTGAPLAAAVSTRATGASSWGGIYLSRTGATQPRIVSSAQGGIVAAYVQGPTDGSATDTGTVRAARFAPGASAWTAAADLSASGTVATAPQLAAGPQGTTAASWISRSSSTDTVQGAALAPGSATFNAAQNLDAAGATAGAPGLAVDGNGNALATWGRSGTTSRASRLDGSTVTAPTPTPVPTPTPTPTASPNPSTNPTPTPTPDPTTPSDPGTSTPGSGSGAGGGATPTPSPSPGTITVPTATPAPVPSTPTTPKLPTPTPTGGARATTGTGIATGTTVAAAASAGGAGAVEATKASSSTLTPSLRAFKALDRRRFQAAPTGAPLAARGTGLRLAFTTNQPGTLRLIVTSVPSHGRAKNLTPFVAAKLATGTTTLVFSGRLGDRPLAAGRYRLKAAFTDAQGRLSNMRVMNIAISR